MSLVVLFSIFVILFGAASIALSRGDAATAFVLAYLAGNFFGRMWEVARRG